MTMDRTLKSARGLGGTRSVLSRAERIAQMTEEGKFDPESGNPLGLPKLKVKHARVGGKAKKEEGAEAAAAAPGAAPAAAAPAAGAAAKKGAAAPAAEKKAGGKADGKKK